MKHRFAGATRMATVVLSAACVLFVGAVINAFSIDWAHGSDNGRASSGAGGSAPRSTVGETPDLDKALELASDHDPFQMSRSRAPAYRMPGEGTVQAAPQRAPRPGIIVVGTVVTPDGGVALVQTSKKAKPRLVDLNTMVAGYRLSAVDQQAATFTGYDGNEVRLAITPPERRRNGTASNSQNGNNNGRMNASVRAMNFPMERFYGGGPAMKFARMAMEQAAIAAKRKAMMDAEAGKLRQRKN